MDPWRPVERAIITHPHGDHELGSAEVRIECGGERWMISGDYKLAPRRFWRRTSSCAAQTGADRGTALSAIEPVAATVRRLQ
jgi:glyoxylase-like metal-dependent hydrolase (beta-lactamase superfamily II)